MNGKKVMLGAWQWVLDHVVKLFGGLDQRSMTLVKTLKMVKNGQKWVGGGQKGGGWPPTVSQGRHSPFSFCLGGMPKKPLIRGF